LLSSTATAPVGKPAASNFERWHDARTDQLLDKLKATTSTSQQHTYVNGLQRIMLQQVPVVALFYGASWGEYSTKSFTGWPSASNPYAPAIPYNWAPLMIITHLKAAT
jgi:peptide/nickel transport system substrate-binding protein